MICFLIELWIDCVDFLTDVIGLVRLAWFEWFGSNGLVRLAWLDWFGLCGLLSVVGLCIHLISPSQKISVGVS